MNIYIDESGNFVSTKERGSWSVVAAFAVPDKNAPLLEHIINSAKTSIGCNTHPEIKLKHFEGNEPSYFAFLEALYALDGVLIATAYDPSADTLNDVIQDQKALTKSILKDLERMRYEGGRKGVELLGAELARLSPQLYVQIMCQLELMDEVVHRAINYFAQRHPETLREFKWRIDRKNTSPISFEAAFEKLSPTLLQGRSLSTPFRKIRSANFDYSYLEAFQIPIPPYLKEDHGLDIQGEGGLDIQKIVRGDIQFVDSRMVAGVQAVDLIVSGIRRCLRHNFLDNELAAARLGRLMVQDPRTQTPVRLIGFRKSSSFIDTETSRLVKVMRANAKPMFR